MFRVRGLGFGVQGLDLLVRVGPPRYEQLPDLVGSFDHLRSGLRFEGSGFRVQGAGSGLRVAGLGFGGLRLRV